MGGSIMLQAEVEVEAEVEAAMTGRES